MAEVAKDVPAKISIPPTEILVPLQIMIEAGAVSDIFAWLENCNEQHPEYRAFWQEISSKTWTLDFIALQKLVSKAKND